MDHPITLHDRLEASIKAETERRRRNLDAFLGTEPSPMELERERQTCPDCHEYNVHCTCDDEGEAD